MSTLTMAARDGEFLVWDLDPSYNRETINVNTPQDLADGTVLGRIKSGAGAKVSGTGDGTVGAVTLGPDAEVGIYVLTGLTESANAGTFSVRSPSGAYLPPLTVAVAYATTHINLTIADGANDWDIGDVIHVTVTGGDYEALDPSANTGEQSAAGILFAAVDASDADAAGVALVRGPAVVKAESLIWPEGISDANKAIALAKLAQAGIVAR